MTVLDIVVGDWGDRTVRYEYNSDLQTIKADYTPRGKVYTVFNQGRLMLERQHDQAHRRLLETGDDDDRRLVDFWQECLDALPNEG